MDVDDFGIDAVCCEHFCGLHAFINFQTGCKDRNIVAFTKDNTFAELKFIGTLIIEYRDCQTSETHVNRSDIFISSFYGSSCFHIIGRVDDHHARDHTHQSDIFVALMCGTVFTDRNTGMRSTDLDIQVRITDGVADLFKSTACCEHGKRACKRNFSGGGKTSCNAHHIALCDTAVDVSFREYFLENSGFGSSGKVGIQYNQIFMFFSDFNKSISVALSCSDFLYF